MSAFRGFVVKEFRHIFRDPRTLAVLFGMPAAQMILFGFAIRNEVRDIRLVVVDPVPGTASMSVVDRIEASPWFRVVERTSDPGRIDEAFRYGRARAALIFSTGFADRLGGPAGGEVQVITDASDPNTAATILAYTESILRSLGGGAAPVGIVPGVSMRFNPELKSVYLFVPGLIALLLMLVCALMTSITITREKELGTMEVLLVSPLRPGVIVLGKVIPYVALSVANLVTILVLARVVFGVPMRGSLTLLLAECLLFIVCALGLGVLISSRSRTQQAAMMVALAGLLLPTVLLSGFIFPVTSMPPALQVVSHFVPAKWFLVIVRGIMVRGAGIEHLWKETLVLVLMSAAFLALSARSFKTRLD